METDPFQKRFNNSTSSAFVYDFGSRICSLHQKTQKISPNSQLGATIQMQKLEDCYYKIIYLLKKQWTEMHPEVKLQETIRPQKHLKKTKNVSSESDEFELEYHQIKKLGLPVNKKKLRIGNWTPQQNLIYLNFLQNYKPDFLSEQERRKNKVFYRLSKILKKRTPDQCRSHHQKLQMKYEDNVDEIIKSIRRKLEKKSPHLFQDEQKKIEMGHKKTGVTESYEEQKKETEVVEGGQFYRIIKKSSSELCLQIFVDQIKRWP